MEKRFKKLFHRKSRSLSSSKELAIAYGLRYDDTALGEEPTQGHAPLHGQGRRVIQSAYGEVAHDSVVEPANNTTCIKKTSLKSNTGSSSSSGATKTEKPAAEVARRRMSEPSRPRKEEENDDVFDSKVMESPQQIASDKNPSDLGHNNNTVTVPNLTTLDEYIEVTEEVLSHNDVSKNGHRNEEDDSQTTVVQPASVTTGEALRASPEIMCSNRSLSTYSVYSEVIGEEENERNEGLTNTVKHLEVRNKNNSRLPLVGAIDWDNMKYTTVVDQWAPAVIYESFHPEVHHQQARDSGSGDGGRIYREILDHDVCPHILPVVNVQVLPTRHFIRTENGNLVEISEHDVPNQTRIQANQLISPPPLRIPAHAVSSQAARE